MYKLLSILIFIIPSCNKFGANDIPTKQIKLQDSIGISNYDLNFSNSRAQIFTSASGNDYLVNVSTVKNSILLYDISKQVLSSELSLSDFGINANTILDFTCISCDKIVLLKTTAPNICLVDKNNREINVKFTFPHLSYGVLQPNNNFRLTLLTNDRLAFGLRKYSKSRAGYFIKPIISVFNYRNDSIDFRFGKYPIRYYFSVGFPSMLNPSVAYAYDKVVLSFGPLHFLDIYDLSNGHFIKRTFAKSNFIPKKIRACKWKTHNQKQYNYFVTEPFYLGFYFDVFRDRFYRVVKHGQELRNRNNQINNFYSASWSIMVFNNSLEPIEEWTVNHPNLDFTKLLITKKGILIPSVNESNKFYFINEESNF
jgi:hypothetical protein